MVEDDGVPGIEGVGSCSVKSAGWADNLGEILLRSWNRWRDWTPSRQA